MNIRPKIKKIPTSIGKQFNIDPRYWIKQGGWLLTGHFVNAIFSFLLAIALANLIPKETYGLYKYILSISFILAISTVPGINIAFIRDIAKGKKVSISSVIGTRLKWAIFGSLASLIISSYYLFNGDITLAICFLIISIFFPLRDGFNTYEAFLRGKEDFKTQNIFKIILSILNALVLIITLVITKDIIIIITINLLSYIIIRAAFLKIISKRYKENTKEEREDFNNTLSYGKHITAMNSLDTISKHLDKVLIGVFLGPSQLAIYSFAYFPIRKIQTLIGKTMGPLALPRFSKKNLSNLKPYLYYRIKKIYLIAIPLIVLYIILVPLLYKIFFPKYLESINYTRVLSLILLTSPLIFLGSYLKAKKKIRALYIQKIIPKASLIIALAVLLPFYGIWGVIFAWIIQHSISAITLIYLFIKN